VTTTRVYQAPSLAMGWAWRAAPDGTRCAVPNSAFAVLGTRGCTLLRHGALLLVCLFFAEDANLFSIRHAPLAAAIGLKRGDSIFLLNHSPLYWITMCRFAWNLTVCVGVLSGRLRRRFRRDWAFLRGTVSFCGLAHMPAASLAVLFDRAELRFLNAPHCALTACVLRACLRCAACPPARRGDERRRGINARFAPQAPVSCLCLVFSLSCCACGWYHLPVNSRVSPLLPFFISIPRDACLVLRFFSWDSHHVAWLKRPIDENNMATARDARRWLTHCCCVAHATCAARCAHCYHALHAAHLCIACSALPHRCETYYGLRPATRC